MGDVMLPIAAGQLAAQYCFTSWQQTLVDFSNAQQAVLANGRSYFNIGSTKPAPEFQIYPWLYTTDGRWYVFSGVWRSPMNHDPNERRWFNGDTTALQTYDGGSAGVVTAISGPSWEVDPDFTGVFPVTPGLIPGSNPAVTLALGDTGGSNVTTLEMKNIPYHGHNLSQVDNLGNPGLPIPTLLTGTDWRSPSDNKDRAFGTFKWEGGDPANSNVTVPAANMPPYRAMYVIKPTARLYYTVP